ncbi:MAG: hypothetical protein C4550_07090 [Nitrospiraceae bacterium]|nr:MAG: hypothetical protein C4550_07090 [Nitrospiraceae bacterium]
MIDETMEEEFYDALEKTGKLIRYFCKGHDFGVDLYDPVVEDMMDMVHEHLDEDPEKLFNDSRYYSILTRGINRHVTLKTRYEIFSALGTMYKKAGGRDRARIKTARMALEDEGIHPALIGIVLELYNRYVFERTSERLRIEGEEVTELQELIEKLRTEPSEALMSRIESYGEKAIREIGYAIFDEEAEDEGIGNLLEAAVRIPCHRTARLMLDVLMDFGINDEEVSRLRPYLVGMFPLLSVHIYNMLDKKDTEFFDRWMLYEFLVSVPDPQVFYYLRRELTNKDYWSDNPRAPDEEAELEFYGEITDWLISLADRRAVHVFIRLLHEGKDMGFQQEVLNVVSEKLRESSWYEEIQAGLRLLDEGENIFISGEQKPADLLGQRTSEYAEFHEAIQGTPTLPDIQKKLDVETTKWNEAYHEKLDGLRPVDIPRPQIQIVLLQNMFREFERTLGGKEHQSMEKTMEDYKRFQNEWMVTPLDDDGGKIPLVMILHEEENSADTFALREHFKTYKKSKVDDLYFEALELYNEGKKKAAAKRISALLQLEPDHPFGLHLARKIGMA